jgi:hypothetical protein
MTVLLPRLDRDAARAIIAAGQGSTPAEVAAALPDLSVVATYSPVGGTRITEGDLGALRREMLSLAWKYGMPGAPKLVSEFEGQCARLLHERLPMTPHEASQEEVWSYLTCCWLLDIAFWRFTPVADERRFIGNVNRNTFRRLWWRAEVLGPGIDLNRLGEDELVSIMERPTIAADRRLARVIAADFLARVEGDGAPERMLLMREGMKRLLRLTPFVALSALREDEVADVVAATFDAAALSLEGRIVEPAVRHPAPVPEPSSVVTQVTIMPLAPASPAHPSQPEEQRAVDIEAIGQVALDIARRTGRVTNITLREVAGISAEEAREVFGALMARGDLLRRGVKRGTHYVVPGSPAAPDLPRPELESALSWLLRRDAKPGG